MGILMLHLALVTREYGSWSFNNIKRITFSVTNFTNCFINTVISWLI